MDKNMKMTVEQPLISIIIPVYNAAKYLKRCLDSVENQTYTNIEVILVDDGATDDSPIICDEYVRNDARFVVYHIENGGVANARNYALDRFSGAYCVFIDADDYVLPTYVEKLYKALENNNVKIASCEGYDVIDGKDFNADELKMNNSDTKVIEVGNYDYLAQYAHCTVFAAIYSRSIVSQIRFNTDLYVGEDTYFFANALKCSGAVAYISDRLYCYVQYKESLSKGVYNEKRYTEIEAWIRVCELFRDQNKRFRISCTTAMCIRCFQGIKKCAIDGKLGEYYSKELIKTMRNKWSVLIRSNISKKYKLSYTWLCITPYVYLKLYKAIYKDKT